MSRAGYADFFPTAPSVLASKKAQADRDAREKARQLQQREVSRRQAQTALHDDYVRDTSGVRSAGSASSTSTATGSVPTYLLAQNLTPSTSNSSPPAQLSPANGAKTDVQVRSAALAGSHRDAPPAIPTPKATPPAAPAPPSNRPKNYLITYDPFLEKDAKKHSQPTYRFNGDGSASPVRDPRLAVDAYINGPRGGKKQLLPELGRARWKWDANYIGPGPPSQVLITNLSSLTTESEVSLNFRSYGDIQTIEVQKDPATGGSLGICSILFRDSKGAKTLGHQAAKKAVKGGNGSKIGMQHIRVVLDREGIQCAKLVERLLEVKRQAEEAKRRPPLGPRGFHDGNRRDQGPIQDPDNRFSKPKPYKAIDEVGARPAVFIASKWIPAERRYIKHMIGRLRNYGIATVLVDETGFYVVFLELRGMQRCFYVCNGEPLFDFRMNMKAFPRGNLTTDADRERSRSPWPGVRPPHVLDLDPPPLKSPDRRKRKPADVLKESNLGVIKDLRTAMKSEVRKRLGEREIYDLLDPDRIRKRRKIVEHPPTPNTPASKAELFLDTSIADVVTPSTGTPASVTPFSATVSRDVDTLPRKSAGIALPRFKKRPPRHRTPAFDAAYSNGSKAFKEAARPLAHRLNQYHGDSDDESTDLPVSRGFSTDLADEDTQSLTPSVMDSLKRKRTPSNRTPSRLKDMSVGTDDEDMGEPEAVEGGKTPSIKREATDLEKEMEALNSFICDSDDEDKITIAKRSHKRTKTLDFTDSEEEPSNRKRKTVVDERDESVDVIDDENADDMPTPSADKVVVPRKGRLIKGTPAESSRVNEVLLEEDPAKPDDRSWTLSTTGAPQVTVEDDDDIILDLDGIQNLVKDDEDFRFLGIALENVRRAGMGNVHAWAYRIKEAKASNMGGRKGVTIRSHPKIEGFYRPNSSGCARTEGYRKIPEAEKSMYLPHRLAVAAKRATMTETSPTQPKTVAPTAAKPVSSSRSNRVNNRRFVAELNNQKQILSGDADVIRFNQLKKRRKPVRFARSRIHNWGLYAMEPIAANDMIIEYVGEIVRQQVADMRERKYLKSGIGSSYLFRIDENTVIDATKRGGIARFINHSCTPNCTAKIIKVEGSKRIVIYALRDIAENEELTYDYKFEREIDSDDRIPCLCGSSGCKGFLN